MKLKGSVHFLRAEIPKERGLTDQEFRLFQLYRRICTWDKRNKHFGTSDVSVREIKSLYLPNWSTGKVSQTRKGLVTKNWLERLNKTRYRIKDYQIIYKGRVRDIERHLQDNEQRVHSSEQVVQFIERNKKSIGVIPMQNSANNVQPNEPTKNSKETLKKYKENIKEVNFISSKEEFPWKNKQRFEALKESAKKRNVT